MLTPRPLRVVRRFGKDEDGAVMILTVILMMLMVKVAMSTFNVGVLSAERIRLQMVADMASYSSAVWQARFLNFCAYTRRAMIANYANVCLITAADGHSQMIHAYHEKETRYVIPGCPTHWANGNKTDPDNNLGFPTPRSTVEIIDPIWQNVIRPVYFSKNPGPGMEPRECAEHLSKMYANAQQVMFDFVKDYHKTIVPDIVKACNDQPQRGLCNIDEEMTAYKTTITTLNASANGVLNTNMVEQKNLKFYEEDIKNRWDDFTDPENGGFWVIPPTLPYFSCRPYWAIDPFYWMTTYPSFCPDLTRFACNPMYDDDWEVQALFMEAARFDFDTDSGQCYTNDSGPRFPSMYFAGWQLVWDPIFTQACFYLPVMMPIISNDKWEPDPEYTLLYKSDDLKMFDMKTTQAEEMEPSVYVALVIKKGEFVGTRQGDGLLFDNIGVPLGDQVQDMIAISRAKAYFQPRFDQSVYKPNLYYPYWEAKLAPVFGGGYNDTTDPLRNNGSMVIASMMQAVQGDGASAPGLYQRIKY